MATSWRGVAVCTIVAGCGLERDWAAWQALYDTQSSTSGSSTEGPGSDTSTNTSGSDTSSADSTQSAEVSTGETSGGAQSSSDHGTATGDATTSSSSTGDAPICGDGLVNAPAEECDDANADETDRCTSACLKIRLAFITSALMSGDLDDIVNADAICKSLAAKAMKADPTSRITDASKFKALVPTSTQTVFERHYHGAGPYQLVNGLRVSDSFDELFTKVHHNAINVDEQSMTRHYAVWTGMTATGESYPGIDLCKNWSSLSGIATYGDADSLDGRWLFFQPVPDNPTEDCGDEFGLYCLEQE